MQTHVEFAEWWSEPAWDPRRLQTLEARIDSWKRRDHRSGTRLNLRERAVRMVQDLHRWASMGGRADL
jgi:hypothetical protein